MLDIKIKNKDCMPKAASDGSAGMDLRFGVKTAVGYTLLQGGGGISFCTGVAVAIPLGWVGLLVPRSGFGTKYKVKLDNTLGIIDSDYRGYIRAVITNTGEKDCIIEDYERICQLVIVPHYDVTKFNVVEELSSTNRGSSGFGDSGRQ